MSNKYFDLLPVQHQTSVNKNFFESTVEQLFAKANLEDVKGFVGRKIPGVDNNTNTVFVEQPAPNRDYYNLEPTVTTINRASGKPDNFIFYEDYIFNHRSKGGLIGNHDRIFKSEQYNFAPPIDLDKFINYQNYYWYSSGPEPIQVLGNVSVSVIIDNIVGKTTYTSPNNIEFKTGMVVQFGGSYASGTDYSLGKSYVVEGVGQNISFVDVPTAELSVSAYSEFKTQPYDGNSVPNATSTGAYSIGDPVGSSVLANILTLANTNINTATFDFQIARPMELTTKADGDITATFESEFGDNTNNTNHIRINVFDNTNKIISTASGTAYGFVGVYRSAANGSTPSSVINMSSTFSNAGGNFATDTDVLTNTLYVNSITDIHPGVKVHHPDCGQATVTTVNATNIVLSHTIQLNATSTSAISFDCQMPKFSINSGSGTKTITLDQYSSTGAELKALDLNTYTGVDDAAIIVSPLDLMNTINDVGINNLSVVATSSSIKLIEANGNAVTITNVTSDARNNPFVGVSGTSGLAASTTAISSTNIENNIYEIFNKTSTSFDINVGGAVNVLRDTNATFINYGDSTKANVQIYSTQVVAEGDQVFFDKSLGTLTAGTLTSVLGTPTTKTFYITTGDTAYGGTKSGSNFTQPRFGKFNHPAYTQFLNANGTVQSAADALAGFDTANIETLYADVSTTGSLLTYAWDTGSWDNTPIQNVADYLVIQRGSKNKNPWSRLNYWYHVDALREPLKDNTSGFSIPSGAIRATRPIIEFQRDLELFEWGNSFVSTVDIVADKPKEELEGLAIGFPINSSSGSAGSTIIFPNNESTIAKKIYTIVDNSGLMRFDEVVAMTSKIVTGGHVFSTGGTNAGKDYYWNGNRWQQAQQKIKLQQAPKFTLYDDVGVKVDNIAKYPNSDFTGCPVFTYQTNDTTGVYDTTLKANVVYQSGKFSSEPTFHNHVAHHTVTWKTSQTSTAQTIPGYLYYKDLNQDYAGFDNALLRNNWHPVSLPTNYRNFSNTATYFAGEVVKHDNQYFTANSDIVAGDFDISSFDYYENSNSTKSKQYVEDIIQITDLDKDSNIFVTSAIPVSNEVIVFLNTTKLKLGTDFTIVTENQGIKLSDSVSLVKGDLLNIKTYTESDRLTNLDAYGFFEIPGVLKYNPTNTEINNVAFGDMLGHFHMMMENQENFTGSLSGVNNFKDTAKNLSVTQSQISQTSDEILTSMYMSKSPTREFLNALRFGNNEYVKFKNKFVNSAETYLRNTDYLNQTNLDIIDTVLKTIKNSKVSKDAHKLTYMAPIGTNYTSTSVTVSNASVVDYTFSNTANVALDTNLFVLTHGNNVLVAEKDFIIESHLPLDIKLDTSVSLAKNDILSLRVYEDSETALVPSSLSKLGMYPAYEPQFKTDTSYQTDLEVIQCHDGSYVPRQFEKIDDIILTFETLIYNNIKDEYRTADRNDEYCFIETIKPSYYQSSDYDWYEINDLLENNFNKWVKANGIDWRNNSTIDTTNEFTWNYNSEFNSPGHWRGIFEYYYDTQTPHTTPWEMFGFVKKPSWWATQYPTAITSSYTAFWTNVTNGYIPEGSKKGYHKRWARPGLVIPVDASGNLKSPQDIIYTTTTSTKLEINNNWKFGDGSPAEYAWKKSSYYPFAIAEAMYLARPALFMSTFYDKADRVRFSAQDHQIVSKATRKRNGFADFTPHGYVGSDRSITLKFGTSTLVDSFLKFQTLSTTTEIGNPIRTINTRLGHKFGGFINNKTLKVFSDSLSIDGFSASQRVPQEDVITSLHTSNYNSRNFYTGVKIIKTATGYTVTGYDTVSQMFDIIPSDKSGGAEDVSEGGTPVSFSIYDSTISYSQNDYVKLGSLYYQAKQNIPAETFTQSHWTRLPALPTEGGASATYYQNGLPKTAKVPYNKHFESVAEVFDLLVSMARHQKASGYDFGEYDTSINDVNDWLLFGKRFLFWSTEDHSTNESITLSPQGNQVIFESGTGKIAELKNNINEQYSLTDADGKRITVGDCGIVREDNKITITPPTGKAIYGCLIHTELVEHAVVFNNTTSFNDLVYNNVLGIRQDRLEINAQRSKNWDGRYTAEGLILTRNGGVLPNFDLLVDSIRTYHDPSATTIDPIKTDLARGLIGFNRDSSLSNVMLSDPAQFEFYKGIIRNKGTANSISSILRSDIVNTNKDIEINEEWAIKRGEFGDVFNHQSMDLNLRQSDFLTDNQQIEVLYPENVTGTVSNIFVYERNTTYFKVPTIEIDAPTGGGNAAIASATLYANALLESVTISNGGDGYSAKPNVAVITGNIVVARIDEVLQNGLAFSSADVDVPLSGTSAISNISITDYTTTADTTVDIDLANSYTLENAVFQINKQLSLSNVTDVVAFSDLDTDVEKITITNVTNPAGLPTRLTASTVHGFNPPSTNRANASIQSITRAANAVITLDTAEIQPDTFSTGDTIFLQNVVGGSGFGALNDTMFYVKATGIVRQYELFTNQAMSVGANTMPYTGAATGGSAFGRANVDYVNLTGVTGITNGNYYVRTNPTSANSQINTGTTQFELFEDNAVKVPVTTGSGNSGSLSVYRSGGDKRLYIRGADFQLAESTLPGGNPSTSLSVLNMVAGRYQPQQRFPIQTANNTTTSDIIVTIGGTKVTSTFFTFDVGARSVNLVTSGQVSQKLSSDQFTVDLTGTNEMLSQNIVERDGQYPYVEFYIDGKEIKNTPSYRAVSLSNSISGTTRVTFSNVSQYANAITVGANVTIAEMGTVQFANTLTTDTPGSKLVIKSVANDTLIANTTSKRTYKVIKDDPTDNRITIDIDDTAEMLKRPTNTIDKGIWPTSSNTQFSIPNAGYVNRANVEWEAYDIQNFANRIGSGINTNPQVGHHVHLAKAENEDWNVYRLNLHGSDNVNGNLTAAQNFVDTTNGQTNLFTNLPLSVYTDSNNIDDPLNTSYFDNHIVVKNAELANIVLKWSNEQLIATPRTIYSGTYVPLTPINRKILSIAPGASGNITAATPNTGSSYQKKIFAKLMVPLSNVEYYRHAGITKDRRLANVNNSVQIVVDNIEGLESARRFDTEASDIVRFFGAGATAAQLTVGKAYNVNEVSLPDPDDDAEGVFYITEANITATSYARLGSDTYVGFESQLQEDSDAEIIGITPSSKKVLFKGTSITNLTTGTNVSLSSEDTLSSVDTIPSGFYAVADVNSGAKTFTVTDSSFQFHDASVSRGAYNQLNFATVGNGDSKGNTYISNAGTDDKVLAGDFVHFISGTNYAGNVYPIQSVTSGVAQFYDNGVTTSSGSQGAVVYTGGITGIQGDISKLYSNGTLLINNFTTTSIGAYGYGNVRYTNSNTSIGGNQGTVIGLSNSKHILKKTSVANQIEIADAGALKPLTTSYTVDIQKDTTNKDADIRLREDVTAGDIRRLLFDTSRKTSGTLDMLKGTKINYGTNGNGADIKDFNSKYAGKPMYIGALSKNQPMSLQSVFKDSPESFRSVDNIEVELEFRYITTADLETLKNLTSFTPKQKTGYRSESMSPIFKTFNGRTAFDTTVDVDWWVDTYTKPLSNPSLDGFSMKLSANNGGTDKTSKIDLIPRFIGSHNSYNFAAPENKFATIAGINNANIDNTNPVVRFKFNDKGRGQDALTLVGRQKNNTPYHVTQSKKNQFYINTKGKGNIIELLPSHPSASDNPLSWWSNNVKSVFTQDNLNEFNLEFGYEDGVSLYPFGTADDTIIPVVIVKNVKVEYTLAPVTALKLDNLRVSLTGGGLTGIVDKKVESADSTFITVDNSDNLIPSNDVSGSVKAVFYRVDKNNNKQVLVNNLGSEITRSDITNGGYSSMLLTTSNANSYLNTGTVFGYVPAEKEHITTGGSLMLGIPGSSTKSISQIFDNDFGAEIKYVGLNNTGKASHIISSVNVTIDTHTVNNETKLFGGIDGLANADVLNIDDTINSPGALDGQTSISNVQTTWFSIPKGQAENIVGTSIPSASASSIHVASNSSVNNTLITINKDNHQLVTGSKVIFYATDQSNYLNNTSFKVKSVTSNSFTINVANTSVVPTTNVAGLKYGAVYNTPSGNLDTQYYVSGQHVAHLACYNNNNVFEPGDNITFNAGSVDTASLNNTTAEVVTASEASIGVVFSTRPTNLTSDLTIRYTEDLTKSIVTMPPKYNINNLYARVLADEITWANFTGYKEINLSTYDSANKINLVEAEFNATLGTTVPSSEVYLPMTIYTATKFTSKDHGIGKQTLVAPVLSTTIASSSGLVNVVIANAGAGFYKQGKLTFSNSVNGHALSNNSFDIIDFVTVIDDNGDQGEQYYTIKAPGATATTGEFSVSYTAYNPNKDRALRFIKNGKYTGFGVPIELTVDTITIETPYLGNVTGTDGFWVNDVMLVEGTSDLQSEMKLRPKLDALVIKNSKIRSFNNKFKIAPASYTAASPEFADPTLGHPNTIPVRGFANSNKKIDLAEENVTYGLDGWNAVNINGAKTSLARTDTIASVSDSLNFASRLKEGSILSSGSIQLGFMFGRRNYKVDNYKSGTYNAKFVQIPADTTNLEKIYSSEYANAPTGNALKNGINRWSNLLIKEKGQRSGQASIRGSYMHDMDNLDDIITRGNKATKATKQGSGHVQVPSLDNYASKNKYVKQDVHNSQYSYLNPALNHVKNKNLPDYGSPHIDVSEGWIMHNGGGGGGWYDGYIDIGGFEGAGYYNPTPYVPPVDGTQTPPPPADEPPASSPDCGAFAITLYDINNPGAAQATQEYDDNLLAIVKQFINRININYVEDGNEAGTDTSTRAYEEYYSYENAWGGFYQRFINAGGAASDWSKYLSHAYGNSATSETKVPYNQVNVDLCDADPGYVKEVNGNLCTNSGEVMFLGNQRISLTENCDPCALADGINSQNSDYRAICGEPTNEPVNCVIAGGGQGWGETDFGDVIDSSTGRYLIEEAFTIGGNKPKVKHDRPRYLADAYAETGSRHDPIKVIIRSPGAGKGFAALVEQILVDKGIDPIEGGYKTIVVRTIQSSEKSGDYVGKTVNPSGSGTQPNWYDIRKHGKDTCNWQNVDWSQMRSKGGQGLQLGSAELRVKGWKGGLSWFKAEIQLSKQTGTNLKNMNRDLGRSGYNVKNNQHGTNAVLGLMFRCIVVGDGGLSDYVRYEDYTSDEGWKYKKIVGYAEKMTDPYSGGHKDRTYYSRDNDGSGYFFQHLWEIHPVQQRRKAGCFGDIDIPVLQNVKIKSAVPFSLGMGCARSPFSEVGDFMPYVDKTSVSSANLALGASLTNEELQAKSTGTGFSAPKVLTTRATGAIQIAESIGVPSQSNPFMTADYLRIDGLATTPRSGEGTRSGALEDANGNPLAAFASGQIEDATGFNYRIGDKLQIVGGQPKTLDNTAYYLDKIEIQNSGIGYNPADTRFEIVADNDDNIKLPGVSVRGVFSPDTDKLEPALKVTGRTASAYHQSFYRQYVETGGGTDKDWINNETTPMYVDTYTSAIEELNIELKRADIALDSTSASDSFKITSRNDLLASNQYKAFIGTRDYENAGSMMMFGLGIHDALDDIGESLIRNSKIYDSFSQDELFGLNGSWICCWEVPNGNVYPNGHDLQTNLLAMTENTKGLLKVFHDGEVYDPETSNEYRHFLSNKIAKFNGRIVKFLRVVNNRAYFKVETTLGLEKEPNFQAYGVPDFMNLYSRFYPIETLNNFQDQTTKSRDYQGRSNAYQLQVEIDSANSSGVTLTGSNQFRFNEAGEGYATVKVTATRPNTTDVISPIDQNWDVFIIQKDISAGYLRMPFTVHLPDELIEYIGEEEVRQVTPVTAVQLAKAMNKLHYNTVYRPVSTPYVKMGESEAVVFRFDFASVPDDAIIQNIDIDFIMRSTMPGDYGMIWLQAPDGTRIPLMQFLGKYGTTGQNDQGGFMPGYDYQQTGAGADEMIFTVSSNLDAQTVQPNGTNLHSYATKVRPWVGNWERQNGNTGKDQNGFIYAGDYDSENGTNLTTNTGAYWNDANNVLRKWLDSSSGKDKKLKGTWYIEVTRPGRNWNLVNDSTTLSRRPDGATNVGLTEYTTAVKTPNIKISYISPSEDPNYNSANKEVVTRVDIVQKGGFQQEFAGRNWKVKAIGSGQGFKARAILSKGELVANENPDMVEQSAQFQVTEVNTAGSITKLRVLDRGVYEQFPAEMEKGIPLKYSDDSESRQRLEGPGFGGRVICSSRSVIDCRQPPRIVADNAGAARPETPVESLVDAINTQAGTDSGLKAEVVDINPEVQVLVLTSDGDGIDLSDLVPGTLDAIGIPPGEYSMNAIGFRSQLGNPGSDYGQGDGNITDSDGNPFNRGDGDGLIMYGTTVPPEFEGLTSTAFGNIYRYDLSNVDDTSVLNAQAQQNVDVMYFRSRRFSTPYNIDVSGGKKWVDKYDALGWAHIEGSSVKLRQDTLVDSSKLKNSLIYSKDTGERVTDLILHDPFKGFIIPEAEKNLTYISDGDPVYYNNDGSNFSKANVGELWWNTNKVRVRWYEQADNNYRSKYWGSYISGSEFNVYEWIESKEIPSEYSGKGSPLSLENYIIDQVFNKNTNTYTNIYYYWVKGIDLIPANKGRTLSSNQVEAIIESPKKEQIPTYSVVSKNTMLLSNAKEYLTDDNSALQTNFARKETKYDNKHESYILLGENAELSKIPADLLNKLKDSLAGEDAQGNTVPDKYLNKYEMYGVKIRPRQTMFKKVTEARRELRTFLNREIGKLVLTSDTYAGWDSGITTANLYSISDWIATGYVSADIKPRLSVNTFKDMSALTDVEDGVFVQVKGVNTATTIYEYDSTTNKYTLVKVVNGTLTINKEFYTNAQTTALATEIRQLLNAIINIIFKNSSSTNKMYFTMLNYILTEQYQTDWFFKSSYFNIRQSADNLEQKATTKIDPFGDMADYIKTVKPYTSKLRDFNDRKIHTDTTKSFATDFDLPPYQPNLSVQARILDPNESGDANIISTSGEHKDWSNTYITAPSKVRTIKEKIFIDRNQSNIIALGDSTISSTLANAYGQPTSTTFEQRITQLTSTPATGTPINHIERVLVHNTTIKDLNTKIANTTFSADVITGLKATRLTTLRVLGYATFLGEELDANLFSKSYFDGIGNEITASAFGYDQTSFDSDGYDSDTAVRNYLANSSLDSELVRDSITYAGFDSNTFFKGFDGPDRPPEHVMLHALEGVQFNVQTVPAGGGANVSYKIMLGLNGAVEYTRIADAFTTTLATAVTKTSQEIYVTDSSKIVFPYSGSEASVIYLGDERITYAGVDGTRLYGIQRGTQGTSPQEHAVGTKIVDASKINRIEFGTLAFGANNDPEQAYWNTASSSLADSTTDIAEFLKDKPGSYFN